MSAAGKIIAGCTPNDGGMVIGTAGWNIPVRSGQRFPGEGTHLQRYARFFRGTEINRCIPDWLTAQFGHHLAFADQALHAGARFPRTLASSEVKAFSNRDMSFGFPKVLLERTLPATTTKRRAPASARRASTPSPRRAGP